MCIYISIFQAFKLCLTGEDGFNLSYESLTSKEANEALSERMQSKDFTDTLPQFGLSGVEEDDDEVTGYDDEGAVKYDEIDSSKALDEEIAD